MASFLYLQIVFFLYAITADFGPMELLLVSLFFFVTVNFCDCINNDVTVLPDAKRKITAICKMLGCFDFFFCAPVLSR